MATSVESTFSPQTQSLGAVPAEQLQFPGRVPRTKFSYCKQISNELLKSDLRGGKKEILNLNLYHQKNLFMQHLFLFFPFAVREFCIVNLMEKQTQLSHETGS